jgi:hypothetical protein
MTPTINYLAKITNLPNCWICPKDLWAQDGNWGYQTPIYMLNWIIRLQAVVENYHQPECFCLRITCQTTDPNVCCYISKPPALDYLLAEEGGVCGKLNHADCCLQIDHNGRVVTIIATNIRKITMSLYKLGMGGNLTIGLASHGFFLSWDPLLLSELSCALVQASLTFSCVSILLA